MKKVVLFSPNGYVGNYLRKKIENEKDISLILMTRESNLEYYEDDYDIMIYSASITSRRKEIAQKYVQDNVVTAISVIEFCRKHHVRMIIYLSSDEIYGELNTDIVNERAIMVEPNLYATTKYLAEKIIMESGLVYYILRLPGIVGETWQNNFICNLIDKIVNNENIVLYNMDRGFNNVVDIDDLTRFILLLIKIEGIKKNEILLLGNTEEVKLGDIALYIKSLTHSLSKFYNTVTNDKRYFTLDVSKAVEFGYSSKKIRRILNELLQMKEGLLNNE